MREQRARPERQRAQARRRARRWLQEMTQQRRHHARASERRRQRLDDRQHARRVLQRARLVQRRIAFASGTFDATSLMLALAAA